MTTLTPDPLVLWPGAVVCTMNAFDVESMHEDRSDEWCLDFLVKHGDAIHAAMVRAAFEAMETLGELDRGDAKKEEMR